MLRRAVDLRPSDGYIVDSLGWAHYKLGHYAGSDRRAGKGDRPQAGRSRRQRSSRRRLLAGEPQDRGAFPVEPRARHEARAGRPSEDPQEDRVRLARRAERRTAPAPSPADAPGATQKERRLGLARAAVFVAALAGARQSQSDAARARAARATDGTNSTASSPSPAAATGSRFEPGAPLSLVVDGPTAAGGRAARRQSRVARGAGARRTRARLADRPLPFAQDLAGRRGARRRLGGRGGGAARARRMKTASPTTTNVSGRRRAPSARTCRRACAPRARVMAGLGERLGPALDPPPLFAVLANPGNPRRHAGGVRQARPRARRGDRLRVPRRGSGAAVDAARAFIAALKAAATICRRARCEIAPAIADALRRVVAAPRAPGWRGCRARARPASRCSTIAVARRARRARFGARIRPGGCARPSCAERAAVERRALGRAVAPALRRASAAL